MKEQEKTIHAEIKKVKEVLNQDLQIPDYQRPYRWTEKNVFQLLEDIYGSWKQVKSAYRIGSVILYNDIKKPESGFQIIDGQQRITTLILILRQLESPQAIKLSEKLKFNHSDSENCIRRNNEYITYWLAENVAQEKADFLNYIHKFCEFVEVRVTNLSEAFQMFDSQNSRGKSLEAYNLLKAYHIRAMEEEQAPEIAKMNSDRKWENATRFVVNPLNANEHPQDILRQLFNEQLYRTRIWSKKQAAYPFHKNTIDEFKGHTLKSNEEMEFPFYNSHLLHSVALNYFNNLQVQVKGMKSRFNQKQMSNINDFVTINQPILNGTSFFDYIESYVEIYKQLFIIKDDSFLKEFKTFYEDHCHYPKSYRAGDQYLRELYKSLIMLLFDKYGEKGVNKFYKELYAVVYRLRLEKQQVKYSAVAKYPSEIEIFAIIEQSKNYFDLRAISELAKKEIICTKVEEVIIRFFLDFGVNIQEGKSDIKISEFKKEV
ncbi:DUF262 domain-containing protein [Wenyingzhuangia sp. 2_MG-2023]|uniref:DUF262 domain-containing protein n=1 Tax=Wenyingzhuangia sp. 2_MG-2023 TaxID=3062639 RepID=UPI0026E28EF0|nr:DUF262 domain-containing protein [Wenyingzhuangia sp. 2_MG-2023]MDO6737373.1 DUF262 domain-containing protein [Wenyingzhuangia sp. 2_MG-2023]